MKYFLLTLLCLPTWLYAQQNNQKYLAGAVPEVNGIVTFSQTLTAPTLSESQIYTTLNDWLQNHWIAKKEPNGKIIYSDEAKGDIAYSGEEYLTFSQKALSLDRTQISYRLLLSCTPGKCEAQITAIRYTYNVSNKNTPERYTAEEQITDRIALNKAKDKMYKSPGKFRIKTIDLFNELFSGLQTALNTSSGTPATPVLQHAAIAKELPATADIPAITASKAPANMTGFKQIAPDKIPGNIIKMLSEDWMLITAGNDTKFNMMTASWGGLGYLYNKPVAFCFISPTRYTWQLMEKNDTYTLTFYTETYRDALNFCGSNSGKDKDKVQATGLTPVTTPSGSKAFSEAWMIIECRKLVAQSITPEAIFNEKLKEEWSGKQLHKMYIGEILNVWVK